MERLKTDPQTNRRPARSRRDGSCVRSHEGRRDREGATPEPGASDRRRQRLERLIDRKVTERLRSERRARRNELDLGRLQRQVERRGGSMRIVIEFPGQPSHPRPRRRRHPKFV